MSSYIVILRKGIEKEISRRFSAKNKGDAIKKALLKYPEYKVVFAYTYY